MTDNLNFNDLQERNNKVLSDISQLQQEEMELYNQLNQADMSPENRMLMIDRINQLSQHRSILYGTLKDQYEFQNQSVSGNLTTLSQQMYAIDIVENELNEAKQRTNELVNQKNDKLRLVQINTYYGKKYAAYNKMMKIIVYACIPLIILGMLGNKGLIPTNLNTLLMGIIIAIALFMIGSNIVDLSNRDNMIFDEYDWAFNKNAAPKGDGVNDLKVNPWDLGDQNTALTCVGAQCCTEGMTYDTSIRKCVPKSLETQITPTQTQGNNTNLLNLGNQGTMGGFMSKYSIGVPMMKSVQSGKSNGENVVPDVSKKDAFSNYASF